MQPDTKRGRPCCLPTETGWHGARITLLANGKIRLEVASLKKEKTGITTKKIPIVFVNDKLKTADGRLMFLILEKYKPKKR